MIKINGKTFFTTNISNVSIRNNEIYIDGKLVGDSKDAEQGILTVKIEGNLVSLICDATVEVTGNVNGSISAGNSVYCGNVNGNVNCGNSAHCNNIEGNVTAGNSVHKL